MKNHEKTKRNTKTNFQKIQKKTNGSPKHWLYPSQTNTLKGHKHIEKQDGYQAPTIKKKNLLLFVLEKKIK